MIFFIAWNILGIMIFAFVVDYLNYNFDLITFFNPLYFYAEHPQYNWFGVICITLAHNLIAPVISIIFWIAFLISFIFTIGGGK